MESRFCKRVTALTASAAMLFTAAEFSAGSFSASALRGGAPESIPYDVNGDGTIAENETAYELNSASDLIWFNTHATELGKEQSELYVTLNAVLGSDIDMSGQAWLPLAYDTVFFIYDGVFDGQGHVIKNLDITNPSHNIAFYGLIGAMGSHSIVKNLGMVDCTINDATSHTETTGMICGMCTGTIENCFVQGGKITTNNTDGAIGGICGAYGNYDLFIDAAETPLNNCYSTAAIECKGTDKQKIGAICGYAETYPTNCFFNSDICPAMTAVGNMTDQQYTRGCKTADFEQGAVCAMLNSRAKKTIWYQDLGSDPAPVLNDTHKNVFETQNKTCPKNAYTNYENSGSAHIYENGICKYCGNYEDGNGAKLEGCSITLDGSIGVDFYMSLADNVVSDAGAYLLVTLPNGKTEQMPVKNTTVVNGKTYYTFRCSVAATEMIDTIKAQIVTSNGKGTEYSYSVQEYGDYLLDHVNGNEQYAKAQNLVISMLNYGRYAQLYKGYRTNSLPTANIPAESLPDLSTVKLVGRTYTATSTPNVRFAGANLSMLSTTTLRCFFEISNPANVKVSHGTAPLTLKKDDESGLYYVEIPGILPQNLKDVYEINVTDGAMSASVIYSPMTYCYQVYSRNRTAEQINLVKALSLFAEEASAYLGGNA